MLADLTPILAQRAFTPEEIRAAIAALLDASFPDETKAAFLRAWADRGETAADLAACAEAILPAALDPGVHGSWNGKPLLDCSGTGGGGLPLLNISTGIMFILAAMGVPVVKHGNRGLTKASGSADVLEALGIRIDLPPEQTKACLEEVGCAFLFAPEYHPSFAAVANVRRQLGAEGRRTIFNLLGPLLNPAEPEARMVGVFKKEHVELYDAALVAMKCKSFAVVYGEDEQGARPLGEVSVRGRNIIKGTIRVENELPRFLQARLYSDSLDSLFVESADQSAHRLEAIFKGEAGSGLPHWMLATNAAIAAMIQGAFQHLDEAGAKAREALDSGRAYEILQRWRRFSARLP